MCVHSEEARMLTFSEAITHVGSSVHTQSKVFLKARDKYKQLKEAEVEAKRLAKLAEEKAKLVQEGGIYIYNPFDPKNPKYPVLYYITIQMDRFH